MLPEPSSSRTIAPGFTAAPDPPTTIATTPSSSVLAALISPLKVSEIFAPATGVPAGSVMRMPAPVTVATANASRTGAITKRSVKAVARATERDRRRVMSSPPGREGRSFELQVEPRLAARSVLVFGDDADRPFLRAGEGLRGDGREQAPLDGAVHLRARRRPRRRGRPRADLDPRGAEAVGGRGPVHANHRPAALRRDLDAGDLRVQEEARIGL